MFQAKILVVDDEVVVAEDIRRQLRSLGYSVVGVASSGSDALRLAGEHRPDLVLMDVKLKGDIDGIETARTIHSRYEIPVIYLTAFSDDHTLERARTTLPLGYLIKPFVSSDLRATVELALFRHRMAKVAEQRGRWLDSVLHSMGDAVLTVDVSGTVTLLNPAAEALTGWSETEAVGKPVSEVFVVLDSQTRRPLVNLVTHVLQSGEISTLGEPHVLLVARDGTERLVCDSAAPIHDAGGAPSGVVVVFRESSSTTS